MLFLCQHIGEKLGDDYTTKYGKVVTIKSACYRCADNYLQKQYYSYGWFYNASTKQNTKRQPHYNLA